MPRAGTVDISLAGRLPAPIEAAAYFVASEALTNVERHARAGRAEVHAGRSRRLARAERGRRRRGRRDAGRRQRARRPRAPARGPRRPPAADQPPRGSDGGPDGVPVRRLRIVLAEDAVLLREGLVGLLERAGHGRRGRRGRRALLAYTARSAPDVVVVDIRMPRRTPTRGCGRRRAPRRSIPASRPRALRLHRGGLRARPPGLGPRRRRRLPAQGPRRPRPGVPRQPRPGGAGRDRRRPAGRPPAPRPPPRSGPLATLTAREREVLALMAEGRRTARSRRSWW